MLLHECRAYLDMYQRLRLIESLTLMRPLGAFFSAKKNTTPHHLAKEVLAKYLPWVVNNTKKNSTMLFKNT